MIALLLSVCWGSEPLVDAVVRNDLGAVKMNLREGADPNAEVSRSSTRRGGLFGLGRMRTTTTRTTAVHAAVTRSLRTGDTKVLAYLLSQGGDPDAASGSRYPPLYRVASDPEARGARRTAVALLDGGADPRRHYRHRTVLAPLPEGEDGRWLPQLLLERGGDPGAYLCDARDPWLVTLLLAEGAEVGMDCFGATPLHRAVAARQGALIDQLLEAGADVHAFGVVQKEPMTPLHVASARGWADGVALLIERGADPNERAGMLGKPPLSFATNDDTAVALVKAGALRQPDSAPALWEAAPVRPREEAAALVARVTDPTAKARIEALGPERFVQFYPAMTEEERTRALSFEGEPFCAFGRYSKVKELRQALGRPSTKFRRGALRTWTWTDVGSVLWVRGGRGELLRVEGLCPPGHADLVGWPRAAVWLALGPPDLPGPTEDRWLTHTFVRYEQDRVVGWGVDWVDR